MQQKCKKQEVKTIHTHLQIQAQQIANTQRSGLM